MIRRLALTVLAAAALIGTAAPAANAMHTGPATPPPAAASATDGPEAVLLADLATQGITAPTADAAITSAHLVCEGATSGVPAATMAATLGGQYGWTGPQAAYFVASARAAFCMAHGTVTLG